MKRLAGIGLLLLVLAGLYVWYARSREAWYGEAAAGGHPLRIGIREDNPPFSFLDGAGTLAGFDVDIARALCGKLAARCELIPQGPSGNLLTFLINGRYDAVVSSLPIYSLPVSLLEPGSVRFTDKYYSFPAAIRCCGPDAGSYAAAGGPGAAWRFVARKGTAFDITPAGLAGKRVGFLDRPSFDYYMRSSFPGAIREQYASQVAANLDLAAGKLDLLLGDSRALSASLLDADPGRDFAFIGPAVTDPRILGSDAGIAVRREDTALLDALNRALAALRADGTYKKINDRYFDFDIYGG